MKNYVFYNVPQEIWHHIIMSKEAKVRIVEGRDTDLNDVTYCNLAKEQIDYIKKEVNKVIN